jgi:hypothetical protein
MINSEMIPYHKHGLETHRTLRPWVVLSLLQYMHKKREEYV